MSFLNPFRHRTFETIRDKYRLLKAPHEAIIQELENAREAVWKNSLSYKITTWVERWPKIPVVLSFWGGIFLLGFGLKGKEYHLLLALFVGLVIYNIAPIFARAIARNVKPRIIRRHQNLLGPYEERAKFAEKHLSQIKESYGDEWDEACETFTGYPPDWDERRNAVKKRDGHKCTKCGYPNGFRRRSRELHVHHITPISEGGTNEMDNLITLCHLCHRKVDEKHAGVHKFQKGRRK